MKTNKHLKSSTIIGRCNGELKINQHILPDGDIIGWKMCRTEPGKRGHNVLVKLLIPAAAKRLCGGGNRKCRAEYAKVLWIQRGSKAWSYYSRTYILQETPYQVGKIVKPSGLCRNTSEDCGAGISFFISAHEARAFAKFCF